MTDGHCWALPSMARCGRAAGAWPWPCCLCWPTSPQGRVWSGASSPRHAGPAGGMELRSLPSLWKHRSGEKILVSLYVSLYVCTCSGEKKKNTTLGTRQLCSFCLELGSSDLSSFLPFSLAVLWTADIETLCSQARQLALQHLIPTHAVLAHFQRLR